jgi:hypothetical protein
MVLLLATIVGSETRRLVEKPWENFGRLGDYTIAQAFPQNLH